MSHAKELLDLVPNPPFSNTADVAAVIDACATCQQACTACADLSVAQEDVAEMRECIARCLDCTDICQATGRALSRLARADHLVLHRLLQVCLRSCRRCSEECGRHADHHRHCAICAQACRACEHACATLLEDEAFNELQKLAGG